MKQLFEKEYEWEEYTPHFRSLLEDEEEAAVGDSTATESLPEELPAEDAEGLALDEELFASQPLTNQLIEELKSSTQELHEESTEEGSDVLEESFEEHPAPPMEEPKNRESPKEESQEEKAIDSTVSLKDVVASTVGTVLKEQQQKEQKRHHTKRQRPVKEKKEPKDQLEDTASFLYEEEPSLAEATVEQTKLHARLRRRTGLAAFLTILLWVPYVVEQYEPLLEIVNYFHYIEGGLLALLCLVATPVFMLGFLRRQLNCFTLLSVTAVFTLLDCFFQLPQRVIAHNCAGVVAIALTLALWGESMRAAALQSSFRMVALGHPSYLVDHSRFGAVKGRGTEQSFYNRAMKEDFASRWQRLLLPIVLAMVVVFGVLSSVGRGRTDDLFWCLSVIGTAATGFTMPFVFTLPFSGLCKKLSEAGAAIAGLYGAEKIKKAKEILLTDQDLFPPGTIRLEGVKDVIGDPRKIAIYAGSLAASFDCAWSQLLHSHMRSEGYRELPLDNFHIHSDGGISATIRGETTILGTATLLRKMSIKLPRSMERKDAIFLAIDGELAGIFGLKYRDSDGVGWALHTIRRNGLTPLLVTKDPNITPRFLKELFGTDGGSLLLDLNDRLNLSKPFEEHPLRPNALLYREGFAPYLEVVAGSKRLCRAVGGSNTIALLGSILGASLSYYLIFMERYYILRPSQLLLFLFLLTLPVLILSYNANRL